MIFLNRIVSHLPTEKLGFDELKTKLDLDDQQVSVYRRYFGLEFVVSAGEATLSELLEMSLLKLLSDGSLCKESIRYILYCHTNPVVVPHTINVVNQLKKKLGLAHAVSFGVTQQFCAGSITALEIADNLLASEADDAKVIILTGELAFHRLLQIIPETTVLSEVSAACLVGKHGRHNRVLSVFQQTVGRHVKEHETSKIAREFRMQYAGRLIDTVKNAVRRAGVNDSDVALILPHNVNDFTWKIFSKNYPWPVNKLYLNNISKTGHCFTSDPFINYVSAMEDEKIHAGDYVVMVSVGVDDAAVGATFAAAVIQH